MTNLALPLPVGSLENYIEAVNRLPMLTAQEEQDLAVRYREDNDLEAARQLVLSHLRFVVKIARGYAGYGLAHGDLIQEGNIGLMKAVKRFDPDVGVRLVSFAVHWIRAEIHEFILRNWRIVKVATTKAQRKLFFNLRGAKKRLGWMNSNEVAEVADDLGVTPDEVMLMEERLNAHDQCFDVSVQDGEEDAAPATYLTDLRFEPTALLTANQTETERAAQLTSALGKLDERSQDIVVSRWLSDPKTTLQSLADKYGVSAERIRQLERNAFKKLRGELHVEFLLPGT